MPGRREQGRLIVAHPAADAATLGRALAAAWLSGRAVADFPALADLDFAESVQDAMLDTLALPAAGWKLGAGTHASRAALALDRCFSGLVPADRRLHAPATIAPRANETIRVECELAVRLGADVDPGAHVDRAAAARLVAALHPAMELPQSRFGPAGAPGSAALVADNGAAGFIVVGAAAAPALLDGPVAVRLLVDGLEQARGGLDALTDHPLDLLADHLTRLARRGYRLAAGEYVLLGGLTPPLAIAPGATAVADFGALGSASLQVRAAA